MNLSLSTVSKLSYTIEPIIPNLHSICERPYPSKEHVDLFNMALNQMTQMPITGMNKLLQGEIAKPQLPPIGIRNERNYCHAISALQMIASTGLWNEIYAAANPELKKILDEYAKSTQTGAIANIGSSLAKLLFPKRPGDQHDITEAFQQLLSCCSGKLPNVQIEQTQKLIGQIETTDLTPKTQSLIVNAPLDPKTRDDLIQRSPYGSLGPMFLIKKQTSSFPLITLPAPLDTPRSIIEHLSSIHPTEHNFEKPEESTIEGLPCFQSTTTFLFKSAPDIFVLSINRSNPDGTIAKGALSMTDKGTSILFPGTLFNETQEVPYELASFACHQGRSAYQGHYISFIRRIGNNREIKYYRASDDTVKEISREEFIKFSQQCSIAVFEKIGSKKHPPPFLRTDSSKNSPYRIKQFRSCIGCLQLIKQVASKILCLKIIF